MELNREQIIKALECCENHEGDNCHLCPYHYTINGFNHHCREDMCSDVITLIKELTEENERLRADNLYGLSASKLAKKVEELSRENERLRNRVVCKVVIPDEKLEEIKNECLERVELDIKAIEADTVRKYHDRVEELIENADDINPVSYWQNDQIAKEMLEG